MNEEQMDRLITVLRDFIMALIVVAVLLVIGFIVTIAGINSVMSMLEEVANR